MYMGDEEKISLLDDIQNMLGIKQKEKGSTEKEDDVVEEQEDLSLIHI